MQISRHKKRDVYVYVYVLRSLYRGHIDHGCQVTFFLTFVAVIITIIIIIIILFIFIFVFMFMDSLKQTVQIPKVCMKN